MNHYAARQRKDNMRWEYSVRNDDRSHAVGYCLSTGAETDPTFADKYHEGGHATAQDAQLCYREYLLDHELKFVDGEGSKIMRVCEHPDCEEFTSGNAFVQTRRWFLCEEHRTREVVEALFDPSVNIISSY